MINYMILLAVLLITLQADYKYIGCYKDASPRALPSGPHNWGYNIESCADACVGYTYFALQAGSWCSCGNDYKKATDYGTSTGCPSNKLGGALANDLFIQKGINTN
eukprot:712184_1